MVITPTHFMVLSALIFIIGVFGVFFNRRNMIVILMSVELMLLAVNLNMVMFSVAWHDMVGQVFTLFILTVAAAESAVGLAILVAFFRSCGHINIEQINKLKG